MAETEMDVELTEDDWGGDERGQGVVEDVLGLDELDPDLEDSRARERRGSGLKRSFKQPLRAAVLTLTSWLSGG